MFRRIFVSLFLCHLCLTPTVRLISFPFMPRSSFSRAFLCAEAPDERRVPVHDICDACALCHPTCAPSTAAKGAAEIELIRLSHAIEGGETAALAGTAARRGPRQARAPPA